MFYRFPQCTYHVSWLWNNTFPRQSWQRAWRRDRRMRSTPRGFGHSILPKSCQPAEWLTPSRPRMSTALSETKSWVRSISSTRNKWRLWVCSKSWAIHPKEGAELAGPWRSLALLLFDCFVLFFYHILLFLHISLFLYSWATLECISRRWTKLCLIESLRSCLIANI